MLNRHELYQGEVRQKLIHMAKRHKHYSGRGGRSSRGGRGVRRGGGNNENRSGGKISHKMKHRRPTASDSWYNSSIPIGDGDLGENIDEYHGDIFNPGRASISADTIEDYYFNKKVKQKSMKMGGLRPGHRNDSEPSLTQSNFRSNAMVFVKAQEVYDPSHDSIQKLINKEKERVNSMPTVENTSLNSEQNSRYSNKSICSEEEETEEAEIDDLIVDIEDEDILDMMNEMSETDSEYENTEEFGENKSERSNNQSEESSVSEVNDSQLFFIDEYGYDETTLPTVRSVNVEEKLPLSKGNLEFNPSLIIGKTELALNEGNGNLESMTVSQPSYKAHPFAGYISNVMKKMNQDEEENEDEWNNDEFEVEYEEEQTKKDSEEDEEDLTDDIKSLQIVEKTNDKEVFKISEPQESDDPEFGFLDEDYAVDTSDIIVSNIRLGVDENSYYVKCYRFFGDHESKWISQDVLQDYLLEDLGFPEHRLQSYLNYVKDTLIPKEEEPEQTYSDINFSDSSDEEEEGGYDHPDVTEDQMEGIDDLIAYTMKYNQSRSIEYETQSLNIVGKGKKKKLLINEQFQLDGETIETLQSKLAKRITNKAQKRRDKSDFIDEENKNSSDLTKKYPYGLHIQNIKDEFETFFSSGKDRFVFPPLDPHGNKTIMKFAKHYSMKSVKAGKGVHTHVVIDRTKKTHRKLPNYSLINQLLNQRPIFMRIDVQRVKEDYVRTESHTIKGKFHVNEGELVGKDAPEIGRDNIGRRLLEKLGWNAGEGLGIHGNKGISQPVMAVVKKNKTGLGSVPVELPKQMMKSRSKSKNKHRRKREI